MDPIHLWSTSLQTCPLPDRTGPIPAGLSSPLSYWRSEKCLQFLLPEGFSLGDTDTLEFSPIRFLLRKTALQPFILRSNLLATHGLDQVRVKLEELPDDALGGTVEFIPQLVRTLGKETTLAMFPSRANRGLSALCAASIYDNVDCCCDLVSLGADIDFEGHRVGYRLAVAILYSSLAVVRYNVLERILRIVSILMLCLDIIRALILFIKYEDAKGYSIPES